MYSFTQDFHHIIFGATSQIGSQCAINLVTAGSNVTLIDNSMSQLESLRDTILKQAKKDVRIFESEADNTNYSIDHLLENECEAYGLIYCIETIPAISALDMDTTRFSKILQNNLFKAFSMSQEFAKTLIARKKSGNICFLSSIYARKSAPGLSGYSASKAALENLTSSLAVEWGEHQIRVNGIASNIQSNSLIDAGLLDSENISTRSPLNSQIISQEQIADCIVFLSSPLSYGITGQIITVDNGFSVNASW